MHLSLRAAVPLRSAASAPTRSRRASRPVLAPLALALALVGGLGACGGDDGETAASEAGTGAATTAAGAGAGAGVGATVDVPAGATFCDVFLEQYRPALDSAVAFGQPGWEESAQGLVELARLLEAVAPEDLGDAAAENVAYHLAQAEQRSASAHVAGSNELSGYGFQNC